MAEVIGARSTVDIKLGQVTNLKGKDAYEMQLVYNSVHLLGQYLDVLRNSLESQDGVTPDVALPFRKRVYATAVQNITAGAVCSLQATGAVNGVDTTPPPSSVTDGAESLGSTGTRELFGVDNTKIFIALDSADAGNQVPLGIGPGVIKVTGAVCGQTVWAVNSRSIYTIRDANTSTQLLLSRPYTSNGQMYLSNPVQTYTFPTGGGYRWEGFWVDGFPFNDGGTYHYNRSFLYPVGICILDGYVLINDTVYGPSPVRVIPAP